MKKTALALILTIVLFSTVFISQKLSLASANPNWRPWEVEISYPTIDVVSPVAGESYPSNDVWLNFTLFKPEDWFNRTNSQIRLIAYCVDGAANGYGWVSDNSDENEIIVEVHDPIGVANRPSSFSFSFSLTGLTDGEHTVEIYVDGDWDLSWGFGYTFPRTRFTVYTSYPAPSPTITPTSAPEPTPEAEPIATMLVTASVGIGAVVCVGLFVYSNKRKH
jgi:hypothetical protein